MTKTGDRPIAAPDPGARSRRPIAAPDRGAMTDAETPARRRAAQIVELILGHRPPDRLPARVRRAIADSQRSSEVLVCLAQFAAIAFFGVFYALTPKAFPADVAFEPVPMALAAYAVFTALRLWLSLRDRLTPAFLVASILIDVAVLMLTIWSFHLQYEQPATIYLKAPTLLYVFILIALRTLRLEPVYVVLAGAAAALGWLSLVLYAIGTAGKMRITHDFAVYMTSQSILIGAEVDKLISIGAVTAVLTIAVIRARRLMIRSASEAHAAAELSRFLPSEVAGEIRRSDARLAPGDAVRREAAVMVIDLRDFTALAARLPPERTFALLGAFQRRIVPAIQGRNGSIDKYLGDGAMATFGAASESASFAADALRAMEDVLAALDAWNAERAAEGEEALGFGVSVTIGDVLFGVMGEASRLEITVIGDAVNLAAKLEKHCKVARRPGLATRKALDRATAQGFAGAARFDDLPAQEIAGVAERHDLAATGARRLAAPG